MSSTIPQLPDELLPQDESALCRLAVSRVKTRRDFQAYLLVYALVNGAIWAAWPVIGLTSGGGNWWARPIVPTLGWGIGLALLGRLLPSPDQRRRGGERAAPAAGAGISARGDVSLALVRGQPRRHVLGGAVTLATLAAFALLVSSPAEAIVGGGAAPPGRWPWMVGILDASEHDAGQAQFCGGVVIGRRRVLTAAHCVEDRATREIDVLVGRTRLSEGQGRRVRVTAISVFPGRADGAEPGLDAAVVTLAAEAGVPPLALAGPGQDAAWAGGTPAWTMGWGVLNARRSPGGNAYYADRLHELQLPVQGDDACENAFGLGWSDFPYRPEWLLCAGTGLGEAGPCFGDSGGPLVVGSPGGWLDVGVLSGGDSCAARGYFDLYARVDAIRAFALGATPTAQPDLLARPRVIGRLEAAARVRCTHGRWGGAPARFSVRWTGLGARSRTVLGRHSSYRLSQRDARTGVRCAVTATNAGGHLTATTPPLATGRRGERSASAREKAPASSKVTRVA